MTADPSPAGAPVIVVDSREQRPLPLQSVIDRHRLPFEIRRGTLRTADYSILGLEHLCLVERKSVSDLAGVVGHGRERFERELARLRDETRAAFLVVEGSASDILLHRHLGHRIHASHVFGSLAAWSLDYGVHTVIAGSPLAAAEYVVRLFGAVLRREQRKAAAGAVA